MFIHGAVVKTSHAAIAKHMGFENGPFKTHSKNTQFTNKHISSHLFEGANSQTRINSNMFER